MRAAALLAAVLLAGCGSDGAGPNAAPSSTAPSTTAPPGNATTSPTPTGIDPAKFTSRIDNPYSPWKPGARWTYRLTADGETEQTVVQVLRTTRTVMGVDCVVVRDTVTVDGEVIEDTYDWYAQDDEGNVWYFGEDTKEYENGKVTTTEGSWEGGVDGAQPGIVMKATPVVGESYRQEYLKGEAEDEAKVVALHQRAQVPYGKYDDTVKIEETSPIDPALHEYKFYARGVGLVLVVDIRTGDRDELVSASGL